MKAIRTVLTMALALSGLSLVHAQPTLKTDGQYRAALGLGASLSSGNIESRNLSLTADAVRATDRDKTSLYGHVQYARSDGVTTAEQVRLGGRQDHNLGSAYFAFGGLNLERNKFSNLKLRRQLSGGLGWHAIKSPTTTFDLFGGLSYTSDKYFNAALIDGQTRDSYDYVGLLLGEESTHKLSETTSAKQRLTVVPNLRNRGRVPRQLGRRPGGRDEQGHEPQRRLVGGPQQRPRPGPQVDRYAVHDGRFDQVRMRAYPGRPRPP